MDWNPKDWTWAPRLDEGFGWLCRTAPGMVRYILKAPLNIDRWNFRRIWAWLKVATSSYYFLALVIIAVFAAPLWLDLVYSVRSDLFGLFENGPRPDKDGIPDISGHYQSIAILITALAALFTAPLALLKAYINERQTTAAEQGLITDRFTKAVEQLGAEKTVKINRRYISYVDGETGEPSNWSHVQNWGEDFQPPEGAADVEYGQWTVEEETAPNLEVRLGAIYALERIAQDSERDHIPIMETLCAYIRENALSRPAADHGLGEWVPLADDASDDDRKAHLERRKERFGDFYLESKAWKWAQGLDAPRADIQAALTVIGRRPNQRIAHERRQRGGGTGGDSGFRLDLRGANLQRADLTGLDLARALLTGTRLEGAHVRWARLEGADLVGARLEGANLWGAHLKSADLSDWTCARTSLRSADFTGAKYLTQNHVNAAFGDSGTILPPGIVMPDHWDDETIGQHDEDPKYQAWLAAGAPPGKPRTPPPG